MLEFFEFASDRFEKMSNYLLFNEVFQRVVDIVFIVILVFIAFLFVIWLVKVSKSKWVNRERPQTAQEANSVVKEIEDKKEAIIKTKNEKAPKILGPVCLWRLVGNRYRTSCDNIYFLVVLSIKKQGFKYCPFCGGNISETTTETKIGKSN